MAVRQCYVSTRWQSASVGAGPVPARWLDRASVRENGYVSTRWQSASVGAGLVPARWLDRASVRENGYDTLALDGPSGWHKACPYIRGIDRQR